MKGRTKGEEKREKDKEEKKNWREGCWTKEKREKGMKY